VIKVGKMELKLPEEITSKTALAIVDVAGQVGAASIKLRTKAGVGVDDQKMKTPSKSPNSARTYAKSYGKRRDKQGRRVDIRDLTITGQMVKSVLLDRVEATPTGAQGVITVTNDQKEKAAYNQALTPWFGLSPADEQAIAAAVEAELQKIISQA